MSSFSTRGMHVIFAKINPRISTRAFFVIQSRQIKTRELTFDANFLQGKKRAEKKIVDAVF